MNFIQFELAPQVRAMKKEGNEHDYDDPYDLMDPALVAPLSNETVATGIQSANRTCSVRTGLLYNNADVNIYRADSSEECCKMCWEDAKCTSFSFAEHRPYDLCHLKTGDIIKKWRYEMPVTSGSPIGK